jgi:hypothetical protein
MKQLKVTASHAKTNERVVAANPSFHSFSANNILLPTVQMQYKVPQTRIPVPRCSPSLLHAHQSKAPTQAFLAFLAPAQAPHAPLQSSRPKIINPFALIKTVFRRV